MFIGYNMDKQRDLADNKQKMEEYNRITFNGLKVE